MCRSKAQCPRPRCPGGHGDTREMQTARQRLSRARRALEQAEATGDQPGITLHRERLAEAPRSRRRKPAGALN
jgi:hypothetical protein